jgi:hypothetical protein
VYTQETCQFLIPRPRENRMARNRASGQRYHARRPNGSCDKIERFLRSSAIDYPIGDYFLEIRRRLRENGKIGGENIKVTEVTDIPDGPLKGYQKTRTSLSAD